MKTKTIAVTGSSGFVGKYLINELRAKDYDIIKLDISEGIDLTNWKKVNEIARFDVVIHLAAIIFIPDSYKFPRNFYHNNVMSTLNMLELCRKFSAKMIYISSYVYGKPQYLPIDENQNCNLIAVSDIKKGRLNLLEEDLVKKYTNYKKMLQYDKIAIVSICTPNYLHYQMTIDALNAKKHVICEKPMALSSSECKNMINAALKNDRKLFIVKQNRYNPPIVAVKKLIDEGKLGRIFQIVTNCYWNRNDAYYSKSDWKGKKAFDGGALYTQFSHFIDLMYWFGGDVKSVSANANNFNHPDIEIEDSGVVNLEFENNIIGSINFTNCSYGKNMEVSILIFAENGTIKIGGKYLNELEYQATNGFKIKDVPDSQDPNEYGDYQGTMSNHHKVYQNVIETLNGNESIDVNGIEGMKTVEIIEAAYKSVNEKKMIKI